MRSPGRIGAGCISLFPTTRYALAAGELGMIAPATAGGALKPMRNSAMNPMAARMMFMITPADTTNMRAPIDFLLYARGSSCWALGRRSSCPSIFTYPPSGIQFSRYSVSPIALRSSTWVPSRSAWSISSYRLPLDPNVTPHPWRYESNACPNPTANCSTRMPTHLAAKKWPSSCQKITNPNPRMSSSRLGSWSNMSCELFPEQGDLASEVARGAASPLIRFQQIVHCRARHQSVPGDCKRDHVRNPVKRHFPRQKRLYGNFVRCVHHRAQRPAAMRDVVRNGKRGEFFRIGRLEC